MERPVRLSRRISRQRSMRLGVVALFGVCGVACSFIALLLGASLIAMGVVQVAILASGVLTFFAPTDRMDARWFHLLPVLVAVEAMLVMFVLAPNGGAVAVIVALNGPLVCFVMERRWEIRSHLLFSTLALLLPVVAGATDQESTVIVLCVIAVMWTVGLGVGYVWRYAEDQAAQLAQLARHDPLTGLANRRSLEDQMAYELTRHVRNGRPLSVLVLDLNGFKAINDTLGHQAGDELLRAAAAALNGAAREQDTVARQGGDEFCVLLPESGPREAERLVSIVKTALAGVDAGGHPLRAAVGRATFPGDGLGAEDLLACADARQREDKPRISRRDQVGTREAVA